MNNHITYSIVEGNPLGHFMIDPKAGEIYTAKHLDREEVSNMVHFDTENKISEPYLQKTCCKRNSQCPSSDIRIKKDLLAIF